MIIPLTIVKTKRYELRKGKFGCYFYDNEVDIDLSLEMVLSRLNISERNRESQLKSIKYLNTENFHLKGKIDDLNKKLEKYRLGSGKLG